MPTLRVWIFYGKSLITGILEKITAGVPGYGRVQVFQNNGTL